MPKVALEVGSQNDVFHRGSYSRKRQGIPQGEGVVEKGYSLDKRLVSCDILVWAHRYGSGEPQMGSPRNTWVRPPPRFKFALSDLIPTRSLIMYMEPTGLDEDCRLFRVRNLGPF